MRQPIRHIIKDFYDTMLMKFDVEEHSYTSPLTTIQIETVLNLKAGQTVTIDTVYYTVVSVLSTTLFTVQANLASPKSVTLPKPIWFMGSPYSVSKKIDEIPTPSLKTPLVWLYEIIRERRIQEPESMTDCEAEVRMFFLDEANFGAWETSTNQADYYTNVINGMDRFCEYMKDKMYNSKYFGKFESYQVTSFAKFGVYTDNKGVENSILNAELSGVELVVTLPINNILNECF